MISFVTDGEKGIKLHNSVKLIQGKYKTLKKDIAKEVRRLKYVTWTQSFTIVIMKIVILSTAN